MGAVETVVDRGPRADPPLGVDPLKDAAAIRQLVRDAVADYDERSLHGGLPPLADLRGGGQAGPRRGRRVRAAAAVPRRPDGRGDLDQRADARCSSPAAASPS